MRFGHLPTSYVQQKQNFFSSCSIPLTFTINSFFHFDLLGSPFLIVLVHWLSIRGEKKKERKKQPLLSISNWKEKFLCLKL